MGLHGSRSRPARWFVNHEDTAYREVDRITYPGKDGLITVRFRDTGEVRRISALSLIMA